MFCKNCGKELADHAEFCSGCGTRIAEQGALDGKDMGKTEAYRVNLRDAGQSSTLEKTNTYILKRVGMFAGVLAFLSLFMAQIKISDKGLNLLLEMGRSIGEEKTKFVFWDILQNFEIGYFLMIVAVGSALLIVLCQLLNHPRLSIIGCIGLSIIILILVEEKHKANAYYDAYKFAAGYVMLNVASLLAYVAAIKCDVMEKSR